MENQHRKIKGYRDLSQQEIDLMNKVKDKGAELGLLIKEISELNGLGLDSEQRFDRRDCLAYAEKDLKQGIMWCVRSVALPQSF